MYRCVVDFEINVGNNRFTIYKDTVWNVERKYYGIVISNIGNIFAISKNIFVNYFEKVEE